MGEACEKNRLKGTEKGREERGKMNEEERECKMCLAQGLYMVGSINVGQMKE
jgi:hypothetical protein